MNGRYLIRQIGLDWCISTTKATYCRITLGHTTSLSLFWMWLIADVLCFFASAVRFLN